MNNIQISTEDDGKTDINKVPVTITQPTVIYFGNLTQLQKQLEMATNKLEMDTKMQQSIIDRDNSEINRIQGLIDQVTASLKSLPSRIK